MPNTQILWTRLACNKIQCIKLDYLDLIKFDIFNYKINIKYAQKKN